MGVTLGMLDVLIPAARTASSKVIPETLGHGGGVIPISSSTVEFSMLLIYTLQFGMVSSLLGALYGAGVSERYLDFVVNR